MNATTTTRRLVGAGLALTATLTMSGCGPDFGDLPLPGTDVPGDTMEIDATFDEALNLATGATVKVNGISVGKVQEVTTEDFKAEVVMKVEKDSHIRQGATARLRYTTPLGELFVDVTNPVDGALLQDNAHLGTDVTDTAPTVEDSLASASLLINGGGLSQLEQVTTELNTAIGGREETIKETFRQINTFLRNANASTANFDRTLQALNRVSAVLAQREETINRAVSDFRPAVKVLRENTDEFVTMTKALVRFAGTANGIAGETKDKLILLLREVEPILAELNALEGDFRPGLRKLVQIAKALDKVVPGDYLQLNAVIEVYSLGGVGGGPETPIPNLPIPNLPLPPLPSLPGLPIPLPGGDLLGLPLGGLGLRTSDTPTTATGGAR